MRKLTPQEKKRLSYEHDRRNDYGENDKASRKAIPLRKRLVARARRRNAKDYLPRTLDAMAEEEMERAEGKILAAERKAELEWRKHPDVPLGKYLAWKRRRRETRSGGTFDGSAQSHIASSDIPWRSARTGAAGPSPMGRSRCGRRERLAS
jgi:hypothetical protein